MDRRQAASLPADVRPSQVFPLITAETYSLFIVLCYHRRDLP
jgi:hypothetical protein